MGSTNTEEESVAQLDHFRSAFSGHADSRAQPSARDGRAAAHPACSPTRLTCSWSIYHCMSRIHQPAVPASPGMSESARTAEWSARINLRLFSGPCIEQVRGVCLNFNALSRVTACFYVFKVFTWRCSSHVAHSTVSQHVVTRHIRRTRQTLAAMSHLARP